MFAISIPWNDFLQVVLTSAGIGIRMVVIFTIGVLGIDCVERARATGSSLNARIPGVLLASAAFVICAAIALFGLYLLIPQVHS